MKKKTMYMIYGGVLIGAVYAWYKLRKPVVPEMSLEDRRANTLTFMKSAKKPAHIVKPVVGSSADVASVSNVFYGG